MDSPIAQAGTGHNTVDDRIVGDGVQGLRVGDQVVINPFWTCGACEPCRMGSNNNCEHRTTIGLMGPSGNSEYTLAPAASVIKTDPNVDPTLLLCISYGFRQWRFPAEPTKQSGDLPVPCAHRFR